MIRMSNQSLLIPHPHLKLLKTAETQSAGTTLPEVLTDIMVFDMADANHRPIGDCRPKLTATFSMCEEDIFDWSCHCQYVGEFIFLFSSSDVDKTFQHENVFFETVETQR